MLDYTYGDCVYFNNIIDTPNEHHKHFILNQIPEFYITSSSKLLDDTFTSLPKSFVDKMIKEWINSHIEVVAHLSKVLK